MRKLTLEFRRVRKPMFLFLAAVWVVGMVVVVVNQFPAGVVYEQVSFTDARGLGVDAEVIRPATPQYGTTQPIVVLVHGFAVSKQFFYSLGTEFALRGFVAISISMDGHGLSEGPFTYANRSPYMAMAALDYVLKTYAGQVDPAKVAIVGHSFGAYTAVKTAYLDPRFKATVAMAAIFNQENIAIVKATPGSRAAGLDLANENLLPYLNATAPQNLLTIVGTDDTMAPPSDSAHIIGAAAGVAYDQVENGTMYGSISAGTAREELVFPDMNHATEAFDTRGQTAAVQWVEAALSLDTADLPPAPRGVGMVTFDAAVLATAVGVFLLLPLFSYAAQLIYREPRDDWYDRAKETDSKIGWQGIIAWTGAYLTVAGPLVWALVGLDGGYTIFPTFSVLDRVIVPFLVAGSGIILCLIIILRRKTAFGQRWVRRPALLSEHPGKAILTGLLPMAAALVLAGLPMSLVILNLAPVGPRLVPFIVVTLLCMGGMVGASFVFRGIIGDHILRRRGFWSGRFLASAISGFAVAGALSLCFIGTFGDFLLGLPPVEGFFGYWVVLGLGLTFVDFVCAQWVHGLTGDPTSAIVAQGLLLGFFLSMIFPLL